MSRLVLLSGIIAIVIIIDKASGQETCRPNPCLNKGKCSLVGGKVVCKCHYTRTGDRCETHRCKPNPCQNKGLCRLYRNGVRKCKCRKGFSGDVCQTDACVASPCSAKGRCKRLTGGKRMCMCSAGYMGETCAVDACSPNPCQNKGRCRRRRGGRHVCSCDTGFTGVSCDRKACTVNPCRYGGTCVEARNSVGYTCSCPPDITGKNCEVDNRVGSFKCQFSFGAMGSTSLLLKDEEECDTWCYIRENTTEQSVLRGCFYPEHFGNTNKIPEFGCGFFDDSLESSENKLGKQVVCFCRHGQCNGENMENTVKTFPYLSQLEM